jgi:hypothetical protein
MILNDAAGSYCSSSKISRHDRRRPLELRTMDPPPAGSVKENAILVSVPDGGEMERSRPVQAEENAAGLMRPIENLLRELELVSL